jgi:Fur family ferric uptake transcriptional regulator
MDELRKSASHPTADEMYRRVKRRLPRISLGTVYRNLDVLSGCGMITKLEIGGAQKRFDGVAEPHYHLVCVRCGCIQDIPAASMPELKRALKGKRMRDYEIRDCRVELIGLCAKCSGDRKRPAADSLARAHRKAAPDT